MTTLLKGKIMETLELNSLVTEQIVLTNRYRDLEDEAGRNGYTSPTLECELDLIGSRLTYLAVELKKRGYIKPKKTNFLKKLFGK